MEYAPLASTHRFLMDSPSQAVIYALAVVARSTHTKRMAKSFHSFPVTSPPTVCLFPCVFQSGSYLVLDADNRFEKIDHLARVSFIRTQFPILISSPSGDPLLPGSRGSHMPTTLIPISPAPASAKRP